MATGRSRWDFPKLRTVKLWLPKVGRRTHGGIGLNLSEEVQGARVGAQRAQVCVGVPQG